MLEALTDIVYHFTYIENFLSIIKNNEFLLRPVISDGSFDKRFNRNKMYFLSTTRSKSVGYKQGTVKLVLDGRKIGHNFKGIPIDYFNNTSSKNTEYEDRIISDKSRISDASKFIKEVHIAINYLNDELYLEDFNIIKEWSVKNNIPIYFYISKRYEESKSTMHNFLMQKGGENIMDLDDHFNKRPTFDDGLSPEYEYPIKINFISQVIVMKSLNDKSLEEKLIQDAVSLGAKEQKLIQSIRNTKNLIEMNRYNAVDDIDRGLSLGADTGIEIHRHFTQILTNDMRRYRTNNIEEYIMTKLNI